MATIAQLAQEHREYTRHRLAVDRAWRDVEESNTVPDERAAVLRLAAAAQAFADFYTHDERHNWPDNRREDDLPPLPN